MNARDLFTQDFSVSPYWLKDANPVSYVPPALPTNADVVVIGSGYTGLQAALTAARAGRHVVVLEASEIGAGCSTRNGGQISPAMKPSLSTLTKRFGRNKALAILREGYQSVDWLGEFITTEKIDCNYTVCGSFLGAHSLRHYRKLEKDLSNEDPDLPSGGRLVEADAMSAEIGTQRYFGGVVYPQDASLQPALYHRGLTDKVIAAGASIHAYTPVIDVRELDNLSAGKLRVKTDHGELIAREVLIATNGYTGSATPWMQRRVIPVGSYIIATESLPPELVNQILPTNRIVCDTRKVIYYYRLTPDRSRIIFGGRVSAQETNPTISAPKLHRELCHLFPSLSEIRISHSWMGYVAFTFDSLAKCGKHKNMHYAMGYCGSGIAASSYLGMRTAQNMLGIEPHVCAMHNLPFPTRPLYSGKPWFLGAAVKYYQMLDRLV